MSDFEKTFIAKTDGSTADPATETKQDAIETAAKGATDYLSIAHETTTAQTDLALIDASTIIRWVKIMAWTGADATFSGTDASAAIGGSYIRIGTTGSPRIPLWTLTRPDTDVVWEGLVTGDIYLTCPASAGKHLVLLVGVSS